MPIVAVVVLTLGFWAIYWFVRMGGLERMQARSAQRKDEAKRRQAQTLQRTTTLRAVEDPRDAAAALMVLIARGADPTAEQTAIIETNLKTVFGFEHELTERMAQARFIARAAPGFDEAGRVLAPLLKARLNGVEKHQLVGMLEEVARFDGPTPTQADAIEAFSRIIGLAPAPAARL